MVSGMFQRYPSRIRVVDKSDCQKVSSLHWTRVTDMDLEVSSASADLAVNFMR